MNNSIKKMTITALFTALVCVATLIIQIPVPATNGYIHPGDALIFVAAVFLGARYGLVAGGLGSALADLISGYAFWAPWTFIIKAVMGLAVGSIARYERGKLFTLRNVLAMLCGVCIMVVGYLLVSSTMQGGWAAAITSVPANIVQGVGGMILFYIVGYPLDRVDIQKYISK